MRTRSSIFHTRLYLLSALLIVGLIIYSVVQPGTPEQLGNLRYPAESAGRIWDRHLDFYEGYELVSKWRQAFYKFLFGSRQQVEGKAIRAYREVLTHLLNHNETSTPWAVLNTRARLIVTLAETGRYQELEAELKEFDATLEETAIRAAVLFAYINSQTDNASPLVITGSGLLPLGWAADRLRLAIARKSGDRQASKIYESRLQARGERLRYRTLVLSVAIAGVILIGMLGLIYSPDLYRISSRNTSILDVPWNPNQGFAVTLYAALLGAGIALLLTNTGAPYFRPGVLSLWSTLFASLPMVWLIHTRLLRLQGWTYATAFGLTLRGLDMARLVFISLTLFAIDAAGTLLITWAGWQLGWESHWSQGLRERMIFGPWESTLLSSVNVVIWAPIFEELGFRGLVYVSLRTRFGPLTAALLSAGLFSALHLNSLPGFLSVFWSGLVLAYGFEQFRSLLPCILTHMASNAVALSAILLFYR